jgi:putative flippase GtrA
MEGRYAFLRFAIAGGLAAVANWLSGRGLGLVMPLEVAVVFAYLVGMMTAYLLNRAFVFEKSGRGVGSEAWRFVLVNGVALVQVWAVTVGLSRLIFPLISVSWVGEGLAHAIGVASPIVTSYLLHKNFTFAKRP